jgi:hypothetical protein
MSVRRALAASLLSAAVLSGCASQQAFRVVDAKSGEPLCDMRVERLEGGYRQSAMPFVLLNDLAPVEKLTTSDSGSVTFEKSGNKFIANPSGRNPAYNTAYVKAGWFGATVLYPGEHREFSVSRKDGVIEIPLQRRWIDGDGPRPEKASAASHDEIRSPSDGGDPAQHDDRSGIVAARPGN